MHTIFRRKIIAILYISISLAIAPQTFAVLNCDNDAMDYQQLALKAGSKEDYEGAARWMNKAVALCPDYRNYHLLGKAEQDLSNYDQALEAYNKAQEIAEDRDAQALSIGRYGQVMSIKGYKEDALALLKVAKNIHSNAPGWMTDLVKELDKSTAEKPLEKDAIVSRLRGLSTASSTGLLSVADIEVKNPDTDMAPTGVDIRINFLFDSVAMDEPSQEKLAVLAAALADEQLSGHTFWLIGHTDIRGDEAYNMALSEKRAEAIYAALVGMNSDLQDRLKTRGVGAQDPLYTSNTEENHRLNRRLQVFIE